MSYIGGACISGAPFYYFWLEGLEMNEELNWSEVLQHRPLVDLDVFATGKKSHC